MNSALKLLYVYFANITQLIYIACFAINFIILAVKLIKKEYISLKHIVIDFLYIAGFFTVFVFAERFVIQQFFPDKGYTPSVIINKNPLNDYEYMSSEVEEISLKIKDDFDKEVYVNLDYNDVYGDTGNPCQLNVTSEDAVKELNLLYDVLSQYNDATLKKLPKYFYIVGSISGGMEADGINFSLGYIFHNHDFIAVCDSFREETIHHEFMHSLEIYLNPSDYYRFIDETESGCQLISTYACSNYSEFVAESWTKSLFNDVTNEYTEMMQKYYSRFLKGYDEKEEIFVAEGNLDGQLYKELNDNEKAVYEAFLSIKPGEYLKVKADKEETGEAKKAFFIDYPEILHEEDYTVTSNGEYAVLYRHFDSISNEEEVKDILNIVKYNLSHWDDLSEDEKLEQVYRQVKSDYFSLNTEGTYYEWVHTQPNAILRLYLKEMGYTSSLEKFKSQYAGIYPIIVEIDEKYYWMNVAWEKEDDDFLAYFLVSDDFCLCYEHLEDPWQSCNDMSLSYAAKNDLYLEEFDDAKIDDYLLSVFKRSREKRVANILCSSKEVREMVSDYIDKKDENGYTRLHQLWFRYISEYSAPGYSSAYTDHRITIYDFTFQ